MERKKKILGKEVGMYQNMALLYVVVCVPFCNNMYVIFIFSEMKIRTGKCKVFYKEHLSAGSVPLAKHFNHGCKWNGQ